MQWRPQGTVWSSCEKHLCMLIICCLSLCMLLNGSDLQVSHTRTSRWAHKLQRPCETAANREREGERWRWGGEVWGLKSLYLQLLERRGGGHFSLLTANQHPQIRMYPLCSCTAAILLLVRSGGQKTTTSAVQHNTLSPELHTWFRRRQQSVVLLIPGSRCS